ncbi:hypothetical protein [Mammaliicoccus sciuri]|uniref:hypothetical protein n=1 Tax=Mammaliicoccus sciuri TaxID=1296 RepID=UPI0020BDC981|nr:hypothetical protein [Mammaliicoccus sciuri]
MPTIKYTREDIAKLENERDQYKAERDELSNKLDKECNDNYKLEGKLHDMTKQRDSLINDLSNYRRVLKVFARLIKGKLAINASDRYIQYQHMLDDIGINTDELEAD